MRAACFPGDCFALGKRVTGSNAFTRVILHKNAPADNYERCLLWIHAGSAGPAAAAWATLLGQCVLVRHRFGEEALVLLNRDCWQHWPRFIQRRSSGKNDRNIN